MVRIAQITDTHLLTDKEAEMRGIKTWYSLAKVLEQVKQQQPDYLLLTGDLADEGEAAAYHHLRGLIDPLEIPAYWLPGNHDLPHVMTDILQSDYLQPDKSITLGNWQLILLNSWLETCQQGEGFLAASELAWLRDQLQQTTDKHVAIAVHHHVVPSGVDWMDTINVLNAAEFWQTVQPFEHVKTVWFGHLHLELAAEYQGIQCFATPSTCTQITPADFQENDDQIEPCQQPGFRLFDLQENGEFTTTVHRIQWF